MKKVILTFLLQAAFAEPSAKLIGLAEQGYNYAKQHNIAKGPMVVIVDFSKPSNEKRLWVYNLDEHKTKFSAYVAHGKRSGFLNSTSFSNARSSYKSSIGFYQILEQYNSKHHGLSIKLNGLESTNNNAYKRGIVIHSAKYVDRNFIKKNHRAGRSWGCFAVSKQAENTIIKLTHKNDLLLAYYPSQSWLSSSKFLNRIS